MRSVVAAGLAAGLALALSTGGCASIMSGQTDQVRVESEPQGQACEVTQGKETLARITTPQTITVPRSSSPLLVTCGTALETQRSRTNNWVMGNFLLFPVLPLMVVGLGVDGVTGAWHGYGDDVMVKSDTQ